MRETSELPAASLRAPIVTRHSRTHPCHSCTHPRHSPPVYVIPAKAGILPCVHTPEATALLPPSTEIDTIRQSSTKHNENSCPPARTRQRHSVGFLPVWIAGGSSQRIGLYVIPIPTHVIPAKAGISRCARVAAEQTHRSKLPSPSRHTSNRTEPPKDAPMLQGDSRPRVDHRACDV